MQWSKRDRYLRIVGKVMVSEPNCQQADCSKTLDAGLDQIAAGLAWWYRKYAKDQSATDARAYEFAEQAAHNRGVGLWQDADPTPPWDWRRRYR